MLDLEKRLTEAMDKLEALKKERDKAKVANNTVSSFTDKDGTKYDCKAGAELVIQHAIATLRGALHTLGNESEFKSVLRMKIAIIMIEDLS